MLLSADCAVDLVNPLVGCPSHREDAFFFVNALNIVCVLAFEILGFLCPLAVF